MSLEQAGFKQARSCTEQALALRKICASRRGAGEQTWICFTDVSKAYDRLDRRRMLEKLMHAGVEPRLQVAIAALHNGTTAVVKVDECASDFFDIPRGTRQGDVLAPMLYSIAVDHLTTALMRLRDEEGRLIGGVDVGPHRVVVLLFADDVVLLSSCRADLQTMLEATVAVLAAEGLSVSREETKVMCIGGTPEDAGLSISRDGEPIERVSKYKYIGVHFTDDLDWQCHVDAACASARGAVGQLMALHGKSIDVRTLLLVYKSLVSAHLENAVGLWMRSHCDISGLHSQARRAMGFILGSHGSTPDSVLRGELGLSSLSCRGDMALLKMYFNLLAGHTIGMSVLVLQHSIGDYMTAWLDSRAGHPVQDSQSWWGQVHRALWARKKCVVGRRGSAESSLWVGDVMKAEGMSYTDAAAAVTQRMKGKSGRKPDLGWLRQDDIKQWQIEMEGQSQSRAGRGYVTPLYSRMKTIPRLEPYLADSYSARGRRRQTLWRWRGWLHSTPAARIDGAICPACEDQVHDVHWHVLSDLGCTADDIVDARNTLWDALSVSVHHPQTHSLVDMARRSLLLTAPEDIENETWTEDQTLGIRLILGGWMSRAELGGAPWWPRDVAASRRLHTKGRRVIDLDELDMRVDDRRMVTKIAQVWMLAVDEAMMGARES